jgi:hypothetical protein
MTLLSHVISYNPILQSKTLSLVIILLEMLWGPGLCQSWGQVPRELLLGLGSLERVGSCSFLALIS